MRNWLSLLFLLSILPVCSLAELPRLTTLSDNSLCYKVPEKPYAVLKCGDIEAVIVDNQAVDDGILPGHRAGYSGVASLKHKKNGRNLFVPNYAGLNFEHIHDGTVQSRDALFEPRRAPMELRVIDENTVELYQAPSPHWKLETCQRYELLKDGTLQLTLECIPRAKTFSNGYIGLFWASYIHQPESLDIHFKGEGCQWIRGITPAHGTLPTHLSLLDKRYFPHDEKFPLTLVFNRSNHRYAEPWYYGVSNGMAFVQMFREEDGIRLSQSPSGGGKGNPAWDFQYFIPDYQPGQRYQLVMRAMYIPYQSPEQIEKASAHHRKALQGRKMPLQVLSQ